jgi:hypothetical protein
MKPARRPWRVATAPLAAWILLGAVGLVLADVCTQLARKPTELIGLAVPSRPRTPQSTWADYGSLFREHSTEIVRPELLAALVQAESSGDPLARTSWRWRWSRSPLELYGPASSGVGILQITDGTFAEARHLCIHRHEVARDGPWYDPRACWFNSLYTRLIPSHAIEMTAARLHLATAAALGARPGSRATPIQKQRVAAAIHLCGPARGAALVRRGFRPLAGERCGGHDLARYLARVEILERAFARMDPRSREDGEAGRPGPAPAAEALGAPCASRSPPRLALPRD